MMEEEIGSVMTEDKEAMSLDNEKELVLSYLRHIGSAARALSREYNGDDSIAMDTDDGDESQNHDGEDCQEYLDQIARDLLTACRLTVLSQPPPKNLPRQTLPPVDLHRDVPRSHSDYYTSSVGRNQNDTEEEEDANVPIYKNWKRTDYLRNLLRPMAPIAMDVAAHICALLVPHHDKNTPKDTTQMISRDSAEAAFLLFATWIPIAPHMTPFVLDLFSLETFPNPLQSELGNYKSMWQSRKSSNHDTKIQTLQEYRILLLTQAAQSTCHFFEQRGDIKILLQWWNWYPLFSLLNQLQLQQSSSSSLSSSFTDNNHRNNNNDNDQDMQNVSQSQQHDNSNDFGFQLQDAIRWNVARIVGSILEVSPLAKGQYYQKLNVRDIRVPWVIHPWILDQEEADAQTLQMQGKFKLWNIQYSDDDDDHNNSDDDDTNRESSLPAPSSGQIRKFVSVHPWLVHVGKGIVFVKHNPITSSRLELPPPTASATANRNHASLQQQQQQQQEQQLESSLNYLSNANTNSRGSRQTNLTRTATTAENLALLGAAMCTSTNPQDHPPPILICGPHGSGKSSLVRELALIFGGSNDSNSDQHQQHHLLEIHVDEETDAKTLIGSYTMTDIPGEFAWKPGALTQAVRSGKWVLIEDVDSVPIEIQAAMVKLLEDRVLPVGVSGKMERCHPNFRLFGTCTTTTLDSHNNGNNSFLPSSQQLRFGRNAGRKILNISLWRTVHVKPLPYSELKDIALSLHPNLPPSISQSALSILKAVDRSGRESNNDSSEDSASQPNTQRQAQSTNIPTLMTGGRNPSVRDFFKLLSRISNGIVFERNAKYATKSQRTLCMAECVDIFLAACPDREKRRQFVQSIVAPTWGLTSELALSYLESRRPTTHIDADFVEVGRAKLPVVRTDNERTGSDGFTETNFSLRLMESIAVGIKQNEPLLLVGETGAGKTSVIQHLARHCGRHLVVQNLSLQTDSTDLLGGYRPLELQHVAQRVYESFVDTFAGTFSRKQNAQFLDFASSAFQRQEWKKLSQCFVRAAKLGLSKVKQREGKGDRKPSLHVASLPSWERFSDIADRFERQRLACDSGLVFAFTEGALVDAIREGKWVLLDEINLASSEILQRLLGLLDDRAGSLTLTERGDADALPRHPDFRLFAAMNPATDAGKKELHPSFRSRFTEIYVDELLDPVELRVVSSRYLQPVLPPSDKPPEHSDIVVSSVDVYLQCRELAEDILVDGAGHKPRFTLRTLARAMIAAKTLVMEQKISLKRAITEGFELAIQGPLDAKSTKAVQRVLRSALGDTISKNEKDHPGRRPASGEPTDYVLIKPFWLKAGPLIQVDWSEATIPGRSKFILTSSAKTNLRRLARAIAAGPWPILLEGPTSAGKTTLVEYIAARVGHRVVRINNHEHTDVQEYTGSFAPDPNGSLSFQDGILVRALRRGEWVILDELNLAPSDVLEALNRLLDDNRQLYLPEINQVIKPHPNFRLFATQNPCGAYGGRKPLSRAFRNRFVELHVADIPNAEMTSILELRCSCPPSHAKVLVAIMDALRQRRSKSGVFLGKDGLITPRDLLRWAERHASSKLHLAQDGYMLLAERLRTPEEKMIVKEEIEKQMKLNIDVDELYYSEESPARKELSKFAAKFSKSLSLPQLASSIAPTKSLLKLLNLILRCIRQREPVLLVGDTGCGKTTVVELLSLMLDSDLQVINCHATTETSDLIGGLRPVRGRNLLANQMLEMTRELLVQWPDKDFLRKLNLPRYLNIQETEELSTEDVDEIMRDENNTKIGDLPDQAVTDMINIVRLLRESVHFDQQNKAEMESPKKKPKLSIGEDAGVLSSFLPVFLEIEELYRRCCSLFEWADGPVASAMKKGDLLLLDELSLAEDAVLERLNSVLEPSRTLVLAEKGETVDDTINSETDPRVIKAHDDFRIFATMNPGGDFGKRELSPALRSRFTEVWVPPVDDRHDIELVLSRSLAGAEDEVLRCKILEKMLDYVEWFNNSICKDSTSPYPGLSLSLRDVLTWSTFVVKARQFNQKFNVWDAYCHGAALMHLDGLGLGTGLSVDDTSSLTYRARAYLLTQVEDPHSVTAFSISGDTLQFTNSNGLFGTYPFWIKTGKQVVKGSSFSFAAPRVAENVNRILRAMQLSKPILLEGSPGVGKTSLVLALANAAGHKLTRINLSEQTDLSDLLGSDLPVPEKDADGKLQASFKWCDGVLLTAIKSGHWVLLDELNLASQSVLEGLNSCLDYRASVFVPELGKTFECPSTFRVFAAQNPLAQGGGRKGLPRSFLNRFTKVHVEPLSGHDLRAIVTSKYSSLSTELIDKMVQFNERVHESVADKHEFGQIGSPWEFNLRDVFRWADLLESQKVQDDPRFCAQFASFIYLQRFRTEKDRQHLRSIYAGIFGHDILSNRAVKFEITDSNIYIGSATLTRNHKENSRRWDAYRREPAIFQSLLNPMEAVAHCIQMEWPCLLVGKAGSGKSMIVNGILELCNADLIQVNLSPSSDVNELVGCFEQVDVEAKDKQTLSLLEDIASAYMFQHSGAERFHDKICDLLFQLEKQCEGQQERLLARVPSLRSIAVALAEELKLAAMSDRDFGLTHWTDIEATIEYLKDGCLLNDNIAHFQWVDGVLARAMEQGSWLLLENVNLCPSSVLDRLNPVMESNGELLMAECGVQKDENDHLKHRVLKAHPNFRLFLTMDAEYGEVSRAMRNRCIEISLLPPEACLSRFCQPSEISPHSSIYVDIVDECWRRGVRSSLLVDKILTSYRTVCKKCTSSGLDSPSIKIVADSAALSSGLLRQGLSSKVSLDIIKSLFPLENILPISSLNLKLIYTIPNPQFRSEWLVYPEFATIDWHGRLLRLFVGQTPKKAAQLMPGDFDVFQLTPCSETLAEKFEKLCSSLHDDASGSVNLRNFLLLLFLVQSDRIDDNGRLAYLKGNDDPMVGTFKLMTELYHKLLCEERIGLNREERIGLNRAFMFDRLSESNDRNSSLMRLPQKVVEKVWQKRMESINRVSLTKQNVLDVSYFIHTGGIDPSSASASCDIIQALYPFCQATDFWLEDTARNLCNLSPNEEAEIFKLFRGLLAQRDRLLILLHDSEYSDDRNSLLPFDEAQFIVQWRWFKKSLADFELSYNRCGVDRSQAAKRRMDSITDIIDTFIFGNAGQKLSPSIWGRLHHPLVPSKVSQWEAIVRLRQLAKTCCTNETALVAVSSTTKDVIELSDLISLRHPALYVPKRDKMELLLAISMLHWSSTDEIAGEMRTRLSNFPENASVAIEKQWDVQKEAFFMRLDKIRIDPTISTVENMLNVEDLVGIKYAASESEFGGKAYRSLADSVLYDFGRLQLSCCAESLYRDEELDLVRQLCSLVIKSTSTVQFWNALLALSSRLRRFVDGVVARTNWPVSDMRPYQTLLWATEDSSLRGDSNRLLQHLLPIMLSAVVKHSTETISEDDRVMSVKMEMPVLFDVESTNDRAVSTSTYGISHAKAGRSHRWDHTRVLVSLVGGSFSPLQTQRRRTIFSTLENHNARALQARDFVQILSAVSFQDPQVAPPYEVEYIAAETLAALRKWIPVDDDGRDLSLPSLHKMMKSGELDQLRLLFGTCTHPVVADLFEPIVMPLFRILQAQARHPIRCEVDTSLARAYIGLLRFHLLLPESPLDPGRKPMAKLELIKSHLSDLRTQLTAIRLSSGIQCGDFAPDSLAVHELLDRGLILVKKSSYQEKKIVERPESAPPFLELFRESRDFATNLCSKEGVLSLISLIENSAASKSKSKIARNRTTHWLETAESFCTRLVTHFGDYEDVIFPVVDAVRLLHSGLRDLVDQRLLTTMRISRQFDTIRSCLRYPIGSISELNILQETMQSISLTSRSALKSRRALGFAILTRLSLFKLSHGLSRGAVRLCNSIFADLTSRELEGRDERMLLEDEELEQERAFREQFPEHRSEFKSLLTSQDEDDTANLAVEDEDEEEDLSTNEYIPMSPEEAENLCLLHRLLFSDELGVNDLSRYSAFRQSVAAGSLLLDKYGYPLTGDETPPGGAAHVMALSLSTTTSFDVSQEGSSKHFYLDPNPAELLKATDALDNMIARITQLLTAFPGNEILLGVFKVADKARKLDLQSTPVGKMMAGLEIILRQAQDWEQHASERVQIGQPLNEISQVVTLWRKLELQSWKELLSSREVRCSRKARAHWTRLFKVHQDGNAEESPVPLEDLSTVDVFEDVCMKGQARWSPSWLWKGMAKSGRRLYEVLRESSDSEATLKLAQIMDSFVLTSPLGEFEERLKLLRSFSSQLYWEAKGQDTSLRFSYLQSARLLSSLVCYYEQFLPLVRTHIDNLRVPIENKLRDQMKLAKWDDQSFYALVDSSEKNHRNLMRHLREYDDVLNLNAGALFDHNLCFGIRSESSSQDEMCVSMPPESTFFPLIKDDNTTESTGLPSSRSISIESRNWSEFISEESPLVGNIRRYSQKIKSMLEKGAAENQDTWSCMGATIVQELCGDIFHRIGALRAEKTTRQMKERALVDLFRELKFHGYSNTNWGSPQKQRQMMNIFQLPSPQEGGTNALDGLNTQVQTAEKYFFRFTAELTRLRSEVEVIGSKHMSRRETISILNYSEHGYLLMSQQRGILSSVLVDFDYFTKLLASVSIGEQKILPSQSRTTKLLIESRRNYRSACESIKQLVLLLRVARPLFENKETTNWINGTIEKLDAQIVAMGDFMPRLPGILTDKTMEIVVEAHQAVVEAMETLRIFQNQNAALMCLPKEAFGECILQLESTALALDTCSMNQSKVDMKPSENVSNFVDSISSAVKATLLAVQGTQNKIDCQTAEPHSDKTDCEQTRLWSCHSGAAREWAAIGLKTLNNALEAVVARSEAACGRSDLVSLLSDLGILCGLASVSFEKELYDFTKFYRDSTKFHYVLIRVFRVLISKGYCSDETSAGDGGGDEGNAGGMSFEDNKDGTGMGEGDGSQDVTDQLESEEQLLGLESDKKDDDQSGKQQQKLDEKEAEQGMEMEGEFDGEMFDMDNPESKEGEESDDEDKEELDREMGLEEDPNEQVVDEKMWDASDDEGGDQANEKFEENAATKGAQNDDRVHTKEDDEQPGGDPQTEETKQQEQNQDPNDGQGSDNASERDINEDFDDLYEESHGVDVRQEGKDTEEVEGEEAMDLDDNLQLEALDEENPPDDADDAIEAEDQELETLEQNDQEGENISDDEQDEGPPSAAAIADSEKQRDEHEADESQQEDQGEDPPRADMPSEPAKHEGLGIRASDGQDACQDMGMDEDEGKEEGRDEHGNEEIETGGDAEVEQEPSGQGGTSTGSGQHGEEGRLDGNETNEDRTLLNEVPNPFKNPGDATKFWHRKLNMVESQSPEDVLETGESTSQQEENADGDYEYSGEQTGTTQVLGEVTEEEAVELEQRNEDVGDANNPNNSTLREQPRPESKIDTRKGRKTAQAKSQHDETHDKDNHEGVNEEDGLGLDEAGADDGSRQSSSNDDDARSEDEVDTPGNRVVSDMSRLENDIEEESRHEDFSVVEDEQISGISSAEAMEARQRWSRIQGETHNLALRLCEKLRLVMEPLVASKLRGDYRTGRRINMRKVISYVASGYRKDKIWLRRTKPAKRNYRVLLAVDDSESMLKRGTGEMALRAMATLALGMSQLEIGELGVASFGDDMRLLHPFNMPFTSESGFNVVKNFKFNQARTRTSLCVQSALSVLDTPGDVAALQIMFLISDGRIERDSRTALRKLIREMMERNILLAMIIVEPEDEKRQGQQGESLVNMKEVTFERGKPIVKRFLEEFPFPYYIILDNMQALPEVLGDALRQWFEMLVQLQEKR